MIRYKVVTVDRESACPVSKFRIHYKKGKVTPLSGSSGIFVFDTLENAKKYVTRNMNLHQILKVKTFGRGRRITACPMVWSHNDELPKVNLEGIGPTSAYGTGSGFTTKRGVFWKCPSGTMLYPSVEVLE